MSLMTNLDFDFAFEAAQAQPNKAAEDQDEKFDPSDEEIEQNTEKAENDIAQLPDGDKEEAEEAAEYDLTRATLGECLGSPALNDLAKMNTCITLEMMAGNAALDRMDIACTEAYMRANTDERREAITEAFKENMGRYWERVKVFFEKIRNTINTSVTRFCGYIKKLAAKAVARVAAANLQKRAAQVKDISNITVTGYAALVGLDNKTLMAKVANDPKIAAVKKAYNNIIAKSGSHRTEELKNALSNAEVPKADDLVKAVVGENTETLKVAKIGNADKLISDIKNLEKSIGAVETLKNGAIKAIDTAQSKVSGTNVAQMDAASMNFVMQAVNKQVAALNAILSACNTLSIMWLNLRVSALKAIATNANGGAAKDDQAKEEPVKNSYVPDSLVDQYFNVI